MDLMVVKLTLDSRDVAKMVEKNHADLLRDIAKYKAYLAESKIAFSEFFQENQYKDKTGKRNKKYDITKKGCEFLAHKMTGKKGAIFTATYINKFHEMEQVLKNPKQTKLDFQEKDIICTTWKGQPVIELVQLARYIHIREDNLHWHVRNNKLTLRYGDLEQYKEENPKAHSGRYSSISILSKEQVIAICKKYGVYEKYKDFIENYFRVDNRLEDKTPKVPVVLGNFDKVDTKETIAVQKAEVVVKALQYIGDVQLRDYIAENISRELLGKNFFRAFDCTMKCLALKKHLNQKGLKHKKETERKMKSSESYLSLPQAGKDIIDSIFE
ncbi:hypothetical protein A2U11_10805 [Fusobacterium necrophorum subsp. funduliforme]|uniref:Rha family transcriptional regulator n=1 Tax=Fusobacterium necrophorum TaxID=859 RepID=UPI000788B590|nr:Rha family transcriptional regulator [Fusobacterium necrophorum]KYM49447.1 hypothetical protein A2U11_10805 [Fusobacterium necrophorum subsp. funduliforme]